jgi:transposase
MLEVTEVYYIRQEVNKKGHTYSDVARRTNTDYRTVKKYADRDEFQPDIQNKKTQPAPVMDPVKPVIDQWLREDMKKKKKYQLTAKRIWQLLVKEKDFKGSSRSVRGYVSKRKRELLEESEDASIPLESQPGEAQVDFGEAPFKRRGEIIDLPYLVLSFPYSNAFYVQVFESQNQDCFLEGLKRFFHHIDGVPRTIRFDNLSPAVKKVLTRGKRDLTDGFEQFALHYGFDYEFCNPGAGNEKGHVEAMVKYVRNNFFLPERTIYRVDDLNQVLWQEAEKDRDRPHFDKKIEIARLYEEDEQATLYLPSKEYSCIRYETLKADKYGYVKVDKKKYSTSPRFSKQRVLIGITYHRIDILTDDDEVIVRHDRLYGDENKSMNWQPYLSLMAKRPTALKYTTFYDQLPAAWQTYLQESTTEEKKKALRLLSTILKDHDFDKATKALETASELGHPSSETIRQVYHQLVHGRGYRETLKLKRSLPQMPLAQRGVHQYDAFFLQKRGEV